MGLFITNLLQIAFLAVTLLVFGRVFLSFVDPGGRSQIGSFVIAATEPILAPIRRVLPATGGIDFSPFVLLVILGILRGLV